MAERYARFARANLTSQEAEELARVDVLATRLARHLDESSQAITVAHVHRASSAAIQSIVAELLQKRLEFHEEVVLTPEIGFTTRARPDFFFRLGAGRGVLADVERGGTTTNNHDLKDIWKAHIASDASPATLSPRSRGSRLRMAVPWTSAAPPSPRRPCGPG